MTEPTSGHGKTASEHASHELEDYAGGHVQAWHGHIPVWLLCVYAVLFIWALYYMVIYWGGLGPGRVG